MAQSALFAAFQIVRSDVDGALEVTRRKEEEKREREEAERLAAARAKRARAHALEEKAKAAAPKATAKPSVQTPQKPSEPERVPARGAEFAKGAFGALLAGAAEGATFRRAAPLKGERPAPSLKDAKTVQPQSTDKSAKESRASEASNQTAQPASASRRDAGRNRTGERRDGRRQASEYRQPRQSRDSHERRPQDAKPNRDHADRKDRPNRNAEKAPRGEKRPRLPFSEIKTPIPPFELAPNLPVSMRADEVKRAIEENRVVIVCGETGSGKTTQLPKIALMAGRGVTGRIAHTQPRRIAASSIAKRIAEELKTPLGDVVGFKVRFTDTTSPGATIKLMTDGILLAETQTDPLLLAYDTVIIDEAHERSVNIDFLLGYLKRLLAKRRDLKVIVTSATIDAERFAEHFAENGKPAPILTISGRTYPVEIRYRPLEDADETDDHTLLAAIERAVSELETAGRGDILVFLPGEREIREAADYLRKDRVGRAEILPLFARLSASEQERVFKPGPMRRIVLATNVAETSITVPGIRFVVDVGTARIKRYSYRSKVEQLLIEPVSQASANQRAGRCGRVADGICIRLYDEEDFARRPAFTDPEIVRSNLAAVILRSMSLKLGDVREFPFVQAPPPRAIADGYSILQEINAIDDAGNLTAVGRALAKLPVDPKLGRMLLAGADFGSLRELLIITSGLTVQDPRERPLDQQQAADQAHRQLADEKSDFLSFVKLWNWYEEAKAGKESNRKFEAEMKRRFLSPRRMREWSDVMKQLKSLVEEMGWRINTAPATFEEVHRALLTGLLGNIGSKAAESDFRQPPYLGARGIRFWIWPGSIRVKKSGRWIFAGQIMETSKLYARIVADIEPEWIEQAAGSLLKKSWSEPHWEKRRGEVVAMERGTLYGLTIYQGRRTSFAPHDPALARTLFIREALVAGEIDTDAGFFKHNQRMVAEIRELEHKTRRPDVLVDDELIFAFYDERLPADVCSKATLEKWVNAQTKEERRALFLSKDELMRHEAAGAATSFFPKAIEMAGVSMALSYHFEPGSPRDGVTITVPLFALNQIDPVRAEWLVPGMVREKAQVLLKSLPQKIRRHCVPLPDYAKGFFERTNGGAAQPRPFVEVLRDDIKSELGVQCLSSDFKTEQLPPHLILNFKVVDEHGRQLDMGRNLADLRAKLGAQAQETFRNVAARDRAVAADLEDQITDWTFGELPELMEISRRGETLIGHPALVDCGDCCAIEVFDDPREAEKEHVKGLRRLFRLSLREQVRFVERSLRELGRMQMQASIVPGLSASFESFESLENDVVDAVLNATALQDPRPNSEEAFRERREDARGRLVLVAGEISRLLAEIVTHANAAALKLKRMGAEKELVEDVEGQFRKLFPAHFLVTVPQTQLAHYPRYLKAVLHRLERWADDPARDRERRADVERLTTLWRRAVAARRGEYDANLETFGWMLEELRVSLFAQQLRTPMPVSVKRLERVWQSIARL